MMKIKAKLSALIRIPKLTRLLLAVFCVLVISVVFVGLDNAPGIVLGWLATAALLTELTRRWRKVRNFLILGFASFVGAIFLSFLHEVVVYPLAGIIGGASALQSRSLGVFHEAVSLIILFFTPVGIFFGIMGAITLVISRLIMLWSKKSVSSNT
jgi:hypothetical protein